MSELKPLDLKTEYRSNLLGTDIARPRISWKIASDLRGTRQTAYRLQVAGSEGDFESSLWDTGVIQSDRSIQIEYGGLDVSSRTRYHYRVKIWDNHGRESDWSHAAWWETGLLGPDDWLADWITPDAAALDPLSEPAFLLRKPFGLRGGIVSARAYVTGVGLYELYLNGGKVGGDVLAPGWTSYETRLQYQTYDVTELVREGANAVGFMLGDGWYKGKMGFEGKRHLYGDRRAALLELRVRYEDGNEDVVLTDNGWKATTGPVLFSEIYDGEIYDARREIPGWSEAGLDESGWKSVCKLDLPYGRLVAQENWPTRVTEIVRPVSSFVTPAGDKVLDLGQNIVGRMRMTVDVPAGTKIVLRHAEVLDKEGNIYFGNLRLAKQSVEYIAKGEGTETYAPHFTFQGFRYVKVEGCPGSGDLPLDRFVGEVIHSDMEPTGSFECSSEMVNQLQSNIRWGQRGNFVDVPTDCPQRNERLGWTGDAQVFVRTALFNFQGGPFFTKWLRDLKADQAPSGSVPFIIPNIIGDDTSSAWGDAAVICPWTVYLCYGDVRLLAEQYDSMKAWVEYIRAQGSNEYMWNDGFHFGDWLGLDAREGSYMGSTPTDLIATAYYACSTRMLRDTAKVLGKSEDERSYGELFDRIVAEFNREFVTPLGRLASSTQTSHVVALMFDLLEGEAKERTARDLNEMILTNDYHLTTGFVGTPYLCFVLSKHGYHETAVKLLLQESYPGWLYSVSKGATTIWEHWDGIKPDGSFWSDDMNSYNHYAYGAIGDWMYRVIAGLDMDESEPAYKKLRIRPQLAATHLTFAKASLKSMYGNIASGWRVENDRVEVEVQLPPNTTAEVLLPGAVAGGVSLDGAALAQAEGILSYSQEAEGLLVTIGSGEYRFGYEVEGISRVRLDEETLVVDLLLNEETKSVLLKHIPNMLGDMFMDLGKTKKLGQLPGVPLLAITQEQVRGIVDDLKHVGEVPVGS